MYLQGQVYQGIFHQAAISLLEKWIKKKKKKPSPINRNMLKFLVSRSRQFNFNLKKKEGKMSETLD